MYQRCRRLRVVRECGVELGLDGLDQPVDLLAFRERRSVAWRHLTGAHLAKHLLPGRGVGVYAIGGQRFERYAAGKIRAVVTLEAIGVDHRELVVQIEFGTVPLLQREIAAETGNHHYRQYRQQPGAPGLSFLCLHSGVFSVYASSA